MTRLSTVGTAEVILHLLAVSQVANGQDPDPYELWKKIQAFINSKRCDRFQFRSYLTSNHNSRRPAGQYLADLAQLVDSGFAEPTNGGRIRITPAGRATASAKQIPTSLHELEEAIIA